jgi:hypothetical protein
LNNLKKTKTVVPFVVKCFFLTQRRKAFGQKHPLKNYGRKGVLFSKGKFQCAFFDF